MTEMIHDPLSSRAQRRARESASVSVLCLLLGRISPYAAEPNIFLGIARFPGGFHGLWGGLRYTKKPDEYVNTGIALIDRLQTGIYALSPGQKY